MTEPKIIPAGEFKARCLALLDRVAATGEPIVVSKRGKPVAKVVPVQRPVSAELLGSVTFHGDLVESILGDWDMDR
jgi:prevent-host-death family protein